MEKNRESTVISCLETVVQEIRTAELTQQLKLPDGMPDIGRVLSAWGQVILRGKEWQDGQVTASGGMLVWVLYAPEDGSKECCIDSWIPFQLKWDLPEDIPEGSMRVRCLTRFVDGRSTSPRKIMVRCGVSALAEAAVAAEREIFHPDAAADQVELLENVYPLRLLKESGEKLFALDEELALPDSAPSPEKLICCRMTPRITDCRVLGDKLAFRGNGNLHILYRSEEGRLHSWDFPIPFSQVVELDREHSADAQADIAPEVTSLETELDEEGHIRLKCGITAQYQISDRQLVTLTEDAYSPDWELNTHTQPLTMPVLLENRRENLVSQQTIPTDGETAVDVTFLADFPRQQRNEQGVALTWTGSFQVLSYGKSGDLQASGARWESRQQLNGDADVVVTAVPVSGEPQAQMGGGQIQVMAELQTQISVCTDQKMTIVTELQLGPQRKKDPQRPSVILRRAGQSSLWELAKSSGSRVAQIRSANGLQGEPAPDQLLLIPIL